MDSKELSRHAAHVRQDIVKMVTLAQSGHPGGSLSIVDMLQVLYFDVMRIDPKRPHWPDRDRFVLSKGHTVPALYATLAERGFFPEDELWHLRQCGAMLQGNPDMNTTPGIDMTTGSLGQGLSAANGMAMTAKLDGADWRVYVIAGDGEIEEGQIWEAAMSAAQYKLDNLTCSSTITDCRSTGPMKTSWTSCPLPTNSGPSAGTSWKSTATITTPSALHCTRRRPQKGSRRSSSPRPSRAKAYRSWKMPCPGMARRRRKKNVNGHYVN